MQALLVICKGLAVTAAVILTWAALFLKVDEEARVQRTFEKWRDQIAKWPVTTSGRRHRVLRTSALVTTALLDHVFGAKLLSHRAMWAATSLSLLSVCVVSVVADAARNGYVRTSEILCGALFLIATATPSIAPRLERLSPWVTLAGTAAYAYPFFAREGGVGAVVMLAATVVFGLSGGVAFVASTRRIAKRIMNVPSVRTAAMMVGANVILALALVGLPLGIALAVGLHIINRADTGGLEGFFVAIVVGEAIGIIASANIALVVVSLSIAIVGSLLLLDSAFWFVLERPVYAAARHGIIGRRKTLLAIAAALVGATSPIAASRFVQILKFLTS